MEELVRSSQHVKASTDWGVYIKFTSDEEPDGSWKYIMDVWIPGRDAPTADVSGLYGIRLDAYTVSIGRSPFCFFALPLATFQIF